MNLLAASDFEADSPFWRVHYFAAVNFLVSMRETLKSADKNSLKPGADKVFEGLFDDFKQRRNSKHADVFRDFVELERNGFHHQSRILAREVPISTRPFVWDGDVSKVKTGIGLVFGEDGDSPLRLLGLAFDFSEDDLRVVDQAVFEKVDENPFSNRSFRDDFLDRSYDRIKTTGLDYYY